MHYIEMDAAMKVIVNKEFMEIPVNSTLTDLIAILDQKLHYGDGCMCALNGALCVNYDITLTENDQISYFPALEGG